MSRFFLTFAIPAGATVVGLTAIGYHYSMEVIGTAVGNAIAGVLGFG